MIHQHPFITMLEIQEDKLDLLTTRLEAIRKDLLEKQLSNVPTVFDNVSTLHYGRWVILSRDSFRDEPREPVGLRLVLSTNYDGMGEDHVENHLTDLVTHLTSYIDELYECCIGYFKRFAANDLSRKSC